MSTFLRSLSPVDAFSRSSVSLKLSSVLSGALLLGACAPRLGYLDHAPASLAPDPQAAAMDSRTMYLDLIRQMQQQGAYYASLAHIDAYRQRYGSTPELRRLQADAYRGTGQVELAGKLYQTLLDSDQAGPALHGLGLLAAARGDNDQAERSLSKAVRVDPLNVAYLGDLGYARLQAGRLSSAEEPLAKAAELAPDNVKAVSNLALWMLLSGNATQADAMMQRAGLPQPARDRVRKLAAQLHSGPAAARPADGAVAAGVAQRQERAPVQPARPTQIAGIPGSMLERFNASSDSSEVRP